MSGKILLGMTKSMVIASFGYPDDINRTVTINGTHEQWIYGEDIRFMKFLYLDNGILTSWQD